MPANATKLHGKATIGVRVGKVLNKYKVGKHFKLDIRDDAFSFEIDKKKVDRVPVFADRYR